MRKDFAGKIKLSALLILIILLYSPGIIYSQIRVFERPTENVFSNPDIYPQSPTRKIISLNGQWDVSFNEAKSYDKFIIPMAFDFEGKVIFKKNFTMDQETLDKFSFILVAEGIEYESEIRINNNFITKHSGGFTPVFFPLTDGIITSANEIVINADNELNFKNTIPLSDQINYSKVYGGITKDIYIIAVPKLFVLGNYIKYKVDNLLTLKISNIIDIKSSELEKLSDSLNSGDFFVQTFIYRRSDSAVAGKSDRIPFKIGNNNSLKINNDINISNPVLWSPENPVLYTVKVVITNAKETVFDEFITETGFTNLTTKDNQVFMSGRPFLINGINYYEDHPRYASALEYSEVFKDMKNIKTMGFNAVRVPGRSANKYIISACNTLGLFVLQEIPFNELSEYYLESDKYVRLSLNYITDIIERDKNSPCIFAWGIGNDFDVSTPLSLEYVKTATALIDSLNGRFKYYTSRAFNSDICSEEVDFTGINFYGRSYEKINKIAAEITDRSKPVENRKNRNLFVSYYGIKIENSNSNGFSDPKSQESQMKFLAECYPKISQSMFGNFIASYADYNSENPLNHPLDANPFLNTSGLYTFNREQKRSAEFAKRMLNKEDLPRIQEGNYVKELPYIFIVTGLTMILILIYFVNRDKKFRSNLLRCLYKPTYFFSLVKDQMIVSTGYNILLAFCISIGLGLYFSSVIFYYVDNNSFDMILAKIFSDGRAKIIFSDISNNKFYLIASLTILNLLLTFITAFFLYFISFYTKGKSYLKIIYSICVWSTLPMLIFLFIGTVLYKLSDSNPAYINITMWLFVILYFLYLNRLIIGAKTLFDIRTGKVYIYGTVIILLIFVIIYSYFYFFTGATETIDLVKNLTVTS
ncbi:MAG: hypothetical protein KDD00_06730 [Ignavibacteriae bacterium]|nr:hypothetical protein [Ignavibacteriota bacterium]